MAEDNEIQKVRIPQLEPYDDEQIAPDDLLPVWDVSSGKTVYASVSKLPFGLGGAGGGATTVLGSPFRVRLADAQVGIITDEEGTHTRITDARLLEKSDYPINSTQVNNAMFRDEELSYDPVNGRVTILNFQLQQGEVVGLFPSGVTTDGGTGGGNTNLLQRVVALEAMMAPFLPTESGAGGGRILWCRPAIEIPAGWVEDTDWRGRLPVGIDVNDTAFNQIGKTGGGKTYTLAQDNLPTLTNSRWGLMQRSLAGQEVTNKYFDTNGSGSEADCKYIVAWPGQNAPINMLNPYRVVVFIKFVGV